MLVRKKKSLSMIVLFGIALFVFSFTIPKPQLSRRRIYDKTKQKSFKTTTSLWETSQERRRLDENRGNLKEETKRVNWQQNYSQVPTQNHGKAKTLLQENRSDKTTSANGGKSVHSLTQIVNLFILFFCHKTVILFSWCLFSRFMTLLNEFRFLLLIGL